MSQDHIGKPIAFDEPTPTEEFKHRDRNGYEELPRQPGVFVRARSETRLFTPRMGVQLRGLCLWDDA